MSPYLTGQGKWVLALGVLMTLVGVLLRQPLIVLFGQVPFVVLLAAAALLLPAARSLDRRCVSFSVDSEEKVHPSMQLQRRSMQLQRRAPKKLRLWMNNGGTTPLFVGRLLPYVSGPVDVDAGSVQFRVDATRATRFSIQINAEAIGRASLQGFDVEVFDRCGLLGARDYIPCVQRFETYPDSGRDPRGRERRRRASVVRPSRGRPQHSQSGTAVRELREFQPGDPLRAVAWKATVRQRRLIAREFDDERTRREYLALDISSSMRAGLPAGEKFDHAIDTTARMANTLLEQGRQVGLWTFDFEVYGEVRAAMGKTQFQRIQRHLVELRSVVDSERTALSEEELQEVLADYLLVQERLDFRHGQGLDGMADAELLRSWLQAMLHGEGRRSDQGAAATGVAGETTSVIRSFFRRRAIELDPPSEVRPGIKSLGFRDVIQAIITTERAGGRLTFISDLCGMKDVDILRKSMSLARRRGLEVRVIAPFSPLYTRNELDGKKKARSLRRLIGGRKYRRREDKRTRLVRDLFTRSERRDRYDLARQLEALGVEVQFVGPDSEHD